MSKQNKIENKRARKLQRENKACALAERQPLTDIPLDVSAPVLTDRKAKQTRSQRREWLDSRSFEVKLKLLTKKDPEIVLAKVYATLSLNQLLRRRHQFARRAATASYVAKKLHPESKFLPPLVATIRESIRRCKAAQDEIDARTKKTPKN